MEESSRQSSERLAQSSKNKQSSPKKQQNKKSNDRVQFYLTEAQMIIIQHHLPHLFSLIPIKNNSRLTAGSKILEKEKSEFVNRKRGRPEGSKSKSKQSLLERKSMRILNKQRSKNEGQKSCFNSSSQSEEQEGVSFGGDLDFSRSMSRFEMRSQKNTRRRSSQNNFPKETDDQQDYLREQTEKKDKSLGKSAQTQSEKKAVPDNEAKKGKLTPLTIFSIDIPKRQFRKNTTELQEVGERHRSKEDQQKGGKEEERNDERKEENKDQQKKLGGRLVDLMMKKEKENQEEDHYQRNNKEGCSQELESKFIQEKFRNQIDILKKLKDHEDILPFLEPVDEKRDGAPNYYSTIDDPIDLQTIEFKLLNNIYKEPSFFHSDIQKMWNNSKQYNLRNSLMMRVTNRLQKFYLKLKNASVKKQPKK